MEPSSQLDDLLRAEAGEGVKDSSGKFTLSREKALEKLSAFRLPREAAWVLKVVQAAMASGCTELDIRQTSGATEFHFKGDPGWSLEQVEEEFFRVERPSETSLDHLRQALWSVSLNGMRPFSLVEPERGQALFWSGDKMLRKPVRSQTYTTLTVSHYSSLERRGLALLPNFQGSQRNAELARELAAHAYTCSKPIRLDNRRLDGLLNCSTHGLNSSSYPLDLGFLTDETDQLPDFPLPPGTLIGICSQAGVDSSMKKLMRSSSRPPSRFALACLVTAHLRKVSEGKGSLWQTFHEQSLVYWVRDGVVVDRTPIRSASSCSLGIFASAAGLDADASGFSLVKNSNYHRRLNQIRGCASAFLEQVEVDISPMLSDVESRARRLLGALFLGGVGLMSLGALLNGSLLWVGGALNLATAGRKEKEIGEQVQVDLAALKREWRR